MRNVTDFFLFIFPDSGLRAAHRTRLRVQIRTRHERKKKPKQTKIKPRKSKLNSCQTLSNQLPNSVEGIYSLEANSLPSSQENPRVLSNH